jgi:hypothetical protein
MFMSSKIKVILLMSALALLNGCSSQTNFVRPDAGLVQLGKSTHEDVIKAVKTGKAIESKPVPYNGETVSVTTYVYMESPSFWGVIIPRRSLTYTSFNNIVIGEEFNSNYDGESTKFDLTKIPELRIGMSELDVVTLLGKPSGRVLYPLVKDKDGSGLLYEYTYARFAGMFTSPNIYVVLITLNSKGVVSDILYKKDNKEQPLASAATEKEKPVPAKE